MGKHGTNSAPYDGLPPADLLFPPREEEALRQTVEYCASKFDRVSLHPDDAHYHLSHACLALTEIAAKQRPERISRELCDRLSRSIISARFALAQHAPDRAARVLLRGFDGLFVLAIHLNEADDERAARHPDVIRDAFDQVRIMRNCAHNESLAKDITERAEKRRADTVASIIETAKRTAA